MNGARLSRRHFLQCSSAAMLGAGLLSPINVTSARHAGEDTSYVCPPCSSPCDQWIFEEAGTCPLCGMTLIKNDKGLSGQSWPSKPLTIEKLMALYRAPGLSLAIINDFRIAETRTYGVTEAGGAVPVTSRHAVSGWFDKQTRRSDRRAAAGRARASLAG